MQSLRAPGAANARAASGARRAVPLISSSAAAASRRRLLAPPARFNAGGGGGNGGDSSGNSNSNGGNSSSAGPTPTVALRLGASADAATLSMPLPPSAARRLEAGLRALHATLRAKQEAVEAGERPRRWPVMEFAFPSEDGEGEAVGGALALQLYCNPNAYSSAFDAKVLVRVECVGAASGGGGGGGGPGGAAPAAAPPPVRMTGEARLTDLQGTLEVYWDEQKQQQEKK